MKVGTTLTWGNLSDQSIGKYLPKGNNRRGAKNTGVVPWKDAKKGGQRVIWGET